MTKHSKIDEKIERRKFIKYGGVAGLSGVMTGQTPGALAGEDEYSDVDDEGNPIDEDELDAESTTASQEVKPSSTPDGTIAASQYEWISGAPDGEGGTGLRLADDGGVDPNFRPSTNDDLTIDFYWRHHSGGSLAYMFNNQDSASIGFRAFTNGIAGSGLFFRNAFGGRDISVSGNFQDGDWYHIRVVLDASQNTLTVYVDGSQVGQSYYNGNGFTARDQFRVMGRRSGTSTRVDYDRFVIAPEAIHPGEGPVTSDLIHYPLISSEGTTVVNEPSGNPVEEKAELIDTIRESATEEINPFHVGGTTISGLKWSAVDSEAAGYLPELEDEISEVSGARRQELLEAANRLVGAEKITQKAAEEPKDPLWEMSRLGAALALSVAIGFASAGGRSALSGKDGYLVDQIRTTVDDLEAAKSSVLGLWALPDEDQREFEAVIEDSADELAAEFVEEHEDEMEDAVVSNIAAIRGARNIDEIIEILFGSLASELIEQFTDGVDELAKIIFYEQYSRLFARGTFDPTEPLGLRELFFDPAYACMFEELNATRSANSWDGINSQINSRVRTLRENVDQLSTDGAAHREKIVTGLTSCIETQSEETEEWIKLFDTVSQVAGIIAVLAAVGTLIAVATAKVTSPEPVSSILSGGIAAFLFKLTSITGFIATTASMLGVLKGTEYTDFVMQIHARGTAGIIEHEVFFQ